MKTGTGGSPHFTRYVVIGALTLAPLWVSWLVLNFILGLLYRAGSPGVAAVAALLRPASATLADVLLHPGFRFVLAVVLTLATLYAVGWVASRVFGRRLIGKLEALVQRVPLVSAVYSATKRLIAVMRERPTGLQRVVLINFPSPEMKTVGFVTRVLPDRDNGREIAAVYVPTAPNPTSGYIELVPVEQLVETDWTIEQAMRFVMTGGSDAPSDVPFSAVAPSTPAPTPAPAPTVVEPVRPAAGSAPAA
jgi:uncharacterized membrane protein